MIGVHLIIDGVLSSRVDGVLLYTMLSELPAEIGMRILAGPLVVEGKPENPGWTGFVIIDKSHIAVHTFDDGNKVSIDVFSCRPFDEKKVLRYLEGKLQLSKFTMRMLDRSEE